MLDLETGEVILDLGTNLQVLGLEANGEDIFDITAFDATTGLGPALQLDPNGIGFLGLAPFPTGTFNLGPILDASFRASDSITDFAFQFGQAGVPAVTATVGNGIALVNDPPPVPPNPPTPPTPEPPPTPPPTPAPPTPSPELPTTPLPPGSLAQGQAQALLNLETGEVTLDIGSNLQILGLQAGGENIFDITGFDATSGLGTAAQLDANGIGFLGLTPFTEGTFNIGAILDESFRTPEALANFTFQFGEAGIPALTATLGNGAFFTDPDIVIPEPPPVEPPTPEPPTPEPPTPEPPPVEPPTVPLPPGSSLGDGEAQAFLDLSTGEVILELGSNLQVLGLTDASGENIFDISAFDATTGLGPAGQLGADGIGFLGLTPFPTGTFNLGAILDQSVRTAEGIAGFQLQFGQAGVPAVTATPGFGVTVISFDAPAIPEPGSSSLFALMGLGVFANRRRR